MRRSSAGFTIRAPGLLIIATALLGAPASLFAQATTATLQGVITATDRSIPPGARVEVRDRQTDAARTALADTAGAFRALGLAPGSYQVTVRAIGYRRQVREDVRLL